MIAGFADHVAPAVVPGNSCLIAVHRPCAMGRSLALGRLTVAIQRYVEGHTANAGTNLPAANKTRARPYVGLAGLRQSQTGSQDCKYGRPENEPEHRQSPMNSD